VIFSVSVLVLSDAARQTILTSPLSFQLVEIIPLASTVAFDSSNDFQITPLFVVFAGYTNACAVIFFPASIA
jgi:hypothetical protein